jgi:superfamily II DNA or RNA helicase
VLAGGAAHLSGSSSTQERRAVLQKLRQCEINIIFSVDVFNEGLDIPEIDTVLFLRPTESATVFLQQLGAVCAGSVRSPGSPSWTSSDSSAGSFASSRAWRP